MMNCFRGKKPSKKKWVLKAQLMELNNGKLPERKPDYIVTVRLLNCNLFPKENRRKAQKHFCKAASMESAIQLFSKGIDIFWCVPTLLQPQWRWEALSLCGEKLWRVLCLLKLLKVTNKPSRRAWKLLSRINLTNPWRSTRTTMGRGTTKKSPHWFLVC